MNIYFTNCMFSSLAFHILDFIRFLFLFRTLFTITILGHKIHIINLIIIRVYIYILIIKSTNWCIPFVELRLNFLHTNYIIRMTNFYLIRKTTYKNVFISCFYKWMSLFKEHFKGRICCFKIITLVYMVFVL